MARKFEDIEVWQFARILVKDIYTLTNSEQVRKNYNVCDQIQRAALSVMNNISEGFERQSHKEFAQFLKIAKGSVGEVRSMLYLLSDVKLIDEVIFKKLYEQTVAISKSLAGFIKYLKNNPPPS